MKSDKASLPSEISAYLGRCLAAQDNAHTGYNAALREISAGRKSSHWIWYIWPSHHLVRTTSRPQYSLPHTMAAEAWLLHPTLGARFVAITNAACEQLERGAAAQTVFGSEVDVEKFHECCTTFAIAAEQSANRDAPPLAESGAACRRALALLQLPAHEQSTKVAMQEMEMTMLKGSRCS